MVQILYNGAWVDAIPANIQQILLFDGGDKTDVTGGWYITNGSTATASAISVGTTLGLYMTTDTAGQVNAHNPVASTVKAIDITNYTKAVITISSYKPSSGSSSPSITVGMSSTAGGVADVSKVYNGTSNATNITLEVDLSSLTGEKYFILLCYYASMYISKIELVK